MAEPAAPTSERDALAAVGRVLAAVSAAGFEIQATLDQIAAEAAALCRAEMSFVFLRDGDVFRFVAASGGTPEHWAYEREHRESARFGAMLRRTSYVVNSAYREPAG